MPEPRARPRIVLACPRLPWPPDTGWDQRMFHTLRGLAAVGDVDLVAYSRDRRAEDLGPVAALCRRVDVLTQPPGRGSEGPRTRGEVLARYVLPRRPRQVAEFPGAPLARRIAEVAAGADLVWVVRLFLADWIRPGRERIIVDLDDLESTKQRQALRLRSGGRWRVALALDALKQWRLERRAPRRYGAVVVCSPAHRAFFPRAWHPRVLVVPNGVDAALLARPRPPAAGAGLVFVGNMDYPPNVDAARWMAERVFPLIVRAMPEARLALVGHDTQGRLRPLHDGARIVATGSVPDVAPFLDGAAISVVPIRVGSGTRIKILEAMALGLPVVSTTVGADGLPSELVRHLRLADTPEAFAAAVLDLLRRPRDAETLGAAGRRAVAAGHTWDGVERDLGALVTDWLARRAGR